MIEKNDKGNFIKIYYVLYIKLDFIKVYGGIYIYGVI